MDTKNALLNTAETLVRTQGFDAFSYADLSRVVGIRKASIHHHFPSKADLARALLSRYIDRFLDDLSIISATECWAAGCITRYIATYEAALGTGDKVCLCVSFAASRSSFRGEVQRLLDHFHAQSLAWLERVFARAAEDKSVSFVQDAAMEAHATLALMEGAQILARARGDIAAFDAAAATLLARLTREETPGKLTTSTRTGDT